VDNKFKKNPEKSTFTKSVCETRKEKLLSLGYSRAQTDKIILRLSSSYIDFLSNKHAKLRKKNLEALFQLLAHQARMALVRQHALSIPELLKLLSYNGGSKSLEALFQLLAHQARMALVGQHALSIPELIKILSHNGGSRNLEALFQLLENETLIKQQWKAKEITLLQALTLIKQQSRKRKWPLDFISEGIACHRTENFLLGSRNPGIILQDETVTSSRQKEALGSTVLNLKYRKVSDKAIAVSVIVPNPRWVLACNETDFRQESSRESSTSSSVFNTPRISRLPFQAQTRFFHDASPSTSSSLQYTDNSRHFGPGGSRKITN